MQSEHHGNVVYHGVGLLFLVSMLFSAGHSYISFNFKGILYTSYK